MKVLALALSAIMAFAPAVRADTPDAGPEIAIPIAKGQPAPEDGVFVNLAKAATIAATDAGKTAKINGYEKILLAPGATVVSSNTLVGVGTISGSVGIVVGVVAGIVLAKTVFK